MRRRFVCIALRPHMKILVGITVLLLAFSATSVGFALPALMTESFPVGTYVIPMDEKQNALTSGDVTVFGFIWEILDDGADIYRIIQPPDSTLYTAANPGGAVYSGGVILVPASHGGIISAQQASFPTVVVDTLTQSFTSDKVLFVDDPTNILIIEGIWGHTEVTLDWMRIPYTIVYYTEVNANPNMLFNYDLVVDDCPGWWRSPIWTPPEDVADAMRLFVSNGGELIFTDRALHDLVQVFPGYIGIQDYGPISWVWPTSIYNPPNPSGTFPAEYPSQYPSTFPDYFPGGGLGGGIYCAPEGTYIRPILSPEVRILMYGYDTRIPDPWEPLRYFYTTLACYFPYGDGLVEAFVYHPQEQTEAYTENPNTYVAAAIFYGNKFVSAIPPIEEDVHDVEAVSQTASDTDVEPGELVDIDVTVTNNGDFIETFNLTCYYDSVPIGTILVVDLAPSETRVVTFTWDTTGVPDGSYSITAWADSSDVIVEVNEPNNWCTMPLKITVGEPEKPPDTIPQFGVSSTVMIALCAAIYLLIKKRSTKK